MTLRVGPDPGGRALGDLLPVIQHDDLVGEAHDHVHLVLDQADRHARPHHLPDEIGEASRLLRIHPAGRFVEEDDLRLGRQSQREGDALALLLRDVGGEAVRDRGKPDEVQHLFGLRPALAFVFLQTPRVRHHVPERGLRPQAVADDEVVDDRRLVEQARRLKGAADPELRHPVGPEARHVPALKHDAPGSRTVKAADQVEEGRLAGAVGTDDGVDLALLEGGGDLLDGRQPAEPLGERLDLKHWPWPPPARGWAKRGPDGPPRRLRGAPAASGRTR